MLGIVLLLVSCAIDEMGMEDLPDIPVSTGEKIAGGSVLQVFSWLGDKTTVPTLWTGQTRTGWRCPL